jgi:hypothetical protein
MAAAAAVVLPAVSMVDAAVLPAAATVKPRAATRVGAFAAKAEVIV